MKSLLLLEELKELPGGKSRRWSFRETMISLRKADIAEQRTEDLLATTAALLLVLKAANVDDVLAQAHGAAFPGYDGSISMHWQEVAERGPDAAVGFMSALKGKVAEFQFMDTLEERGYENIEIAASPTQEVWDISAIAPSGEHERWQVKSGDTGYATQVQQEMAANPEVHFAVSEELYATVLAARPEDVDRLVEIESTFEVEESAAAGLELLGENMGIDIPDTLDAALPGISGILFGYHILKAAGRTSREFQSADKASRNKVHVVRTALLISRFGLPAVSAVAGAAAGTAALPGLGTFVGGVAGAFGGSKAAKSLRPHLLTRTLGFVGLDRDDLYYLRNKSVIDQCALSFRKMADSLVARQAVVLN